MRITNGTFAPYDVSYEYYANGWLKSVNEGQDLIAEYTYDEAGNREQTDYGNDAYTEYAYDDTDPRYFLDSITHKYDTTTLAAIDYTGTARDLVGNPKSMDDDWTGEWDYYYDANNRLVEATPPLLPVPVQRAGGVYGYDWVGNRLNPPAGANAMVYNDVDQLTEWPGMHGDATHAGYTYYDDGSLHQVMDAAGTTELAHYTYTPTGLLEVATYINEFGQTETLDNTWDADSHRVRWELGPTNWQTLAYDPTAGIPAVLKESFEGYGIYYIRAPNGSLIARLEGTAGLRYYHFDELGSTRLLTNEEGEVTNRYSYDAYGSLLSHDRFYFETPEYSGAVEQPYQYVGQLGYYTHWERPEFGLLQLGVRFYDPQIGRFTQQDPVFQGLNLYTYVANRPGVGADPSGENWYIDYEKEYARCMGGCLGITGSGGVVAAVGTVAKLIVDNCFKRGTWVSWSVCATAVAQGLKALKDAVIGVGGIKILGMRCAAVTGAVVLGCSAYCYAQAW